MRGSWEPICGRSLGFELVNNTSRKVGKTAKKQAHSWLRPSWWKGPHSNGLDYGLSQTWGLELCLYPPPQGLRLVRLGAEDLQDGAEGVKTYRWEHHYQLPGETVDIEASCHPEVDQPSCQRKPNPNTDRRHCPESSFFQLTPRVTQALSQKVHV